MKKLAVLMPTYNAAAYLNESIDSVLYQSYTDFDLFVLDDNSQDDSARIIKKKNDSRILYRSNTTNLGISKTLNLGLNEVLEKYELIARMDADDWCYPERFKKQITYLNKNTEVVMCGTQGYHTKDIKTSPNMTWKYPVSHDHIKYSLLFTASFNHQSVMMRSKFLLDNHLHYDESIESCEDWELWTRIAKLGKVVNIDEILMKIRILENSNHRNPKHRELHLRERSQIISDYYKTFNINLSATDIYNIYYSEKSIGEEQLLTDLNKIISAFNALEKNELKELESHIQHSLKYRFGREILAFWKRSGVSKVSPKIWLKVLKNVHFTSKTRLIKNLIS